ncbi:MULTISPECIES: hypothetical protein [unclassified Meiothermus]|uniref:hypothetical protein n=1 Tax=unclassified Meiothermus TaxID=370471 RepID=UPI0018F128A5|nr:MULTISPECIES: hypothetical protein [unclassified Meiothermus]
MAEQLRTAAIQNYRIELDEDVSRELAQEYAAGLEMANEDLSELSVQETEFLPITTRAYLYLSGTPFRALATGEFIEEQIFNWTYTDEQRTGARFAEEHPGEKNPYAALPELRLLTYQMPDELLAVASSGGFDTKTITLSCGKVTTGVTVPQWSAILMLRNLQSPETYFQAAFRVQSPWVIPNPEGDDPNAEAIVKPVCFASTSRRRGPCASSPNTPSALRCTSRTRKRRWPTWCRSCRCWPTTART